MHRYRKKFLERRGSSHRATKTCRRCYICHGRTSHSASVLHCKLCHAGKCFSCILSLGIHSAEAVFFYDKNPTHKTWHSQHKRREYLADIRTRDLEAEITGAPCSRLNKLIAVAANFNTCIPSKQDFITPGWYDKFIQISSVGFHSLCVIYI